MYIIIFISFEPRSIVWKKRVLYFNYIAKHRICVCADFLLFSKEKEQVISVRYSLFILKHDNSNLTFLLNCKVFKRNLKKY